MQNFFRFIFVSALALCCACASTCAVHDPAVRNIFSGLPPGTYALFDTDHGIFVAHLFTEQAPRTTTNFIGLVEGVRPFTDPVTGQVMRRPFYDGTIVYRTIKNGLIEMGDRTGTGNGEIGYYFDDEFVPELKHNKIGILSMGTDGPGTNTNQAQFAIALRLRPDLDMKYSVFGEVVRGVEVAQAIGAVPLAPPPPGVRRSERPATPEPLIHTIRIYRIEAGGTLVASPKLPDIDIHARPMSPIKK